MKNGFNQLNILFYDSDGILQDGSSTLPLSTRKINVKSKQEMGRMEKGSQT